MSSSPRAMRIGVHRGWTEFRHTITGPEGYSFNVFVAGITLVVLYFLRHHTIKGTSFSLATMALPGVVGTLVAFNTTLSAALVVAVEREDGTLLRVKAAPYGVVAYVTGQAVRIPLSTLLSVLFVLVPGFVLFPDLRGTSVGGWSTLVWVFVLGVLASLPFGMVIGALARDPRKPAQSIGMLSTVLIAISGIFYPISSMPSWLHPVAQVFPYYWLGLGMRSALLPHTAMAVELSGSWQHLPTLAVLGAWAVVGLLLAPGVLRKVARREAGSIVQAARHRAAQRSG